MCGWSETQPECRTIRSVRRGTWLLAKAFPKGNNNRSWTCSRATSLKHRNRRCHTLSQTLRTPGTLPRVSEGSPRSDHYHTDSNTSRYKTSPDCTCCLSFPAGKAGKAVVTRKGAPGSNLQRFSIGKVDRLLYFSIFALDFYYVI